MAEAFIPHQRNLCPNRCSKSAGACAVVAGFVQRQMHLCTDDNFQTTTSVSMQLQWLPAVFTIAVCLQSQQYLCGDGSLYGASGLYAVTSACMYAEACVQHVCRSICVTSAVCMPWLQHVCGDRDIPAKAETFIQRQLHIYLACVAYVREGMYRAFMLQQRPLCKGIHETVEVFMPQQRHMQRHVSQHIHLFKGICETVEVFMQKQRRISHGRGIYTASKEFMPQ
jgi:hypothetical protein